MRKYNLQKIEELEQMYQNSLNECGFAGEILLEENELLQLCMELKNYNQYLQSNKLNNLLLVVCINIAYYYYDDAGFWKHFRELCELNETYFTNYVIGTKLERVLTEKKLIKYVRVGTFRYVGAILEQIGVTRRNISIFAIKIKHMINKYGIDQLMNISYSQYSTIIQEAYFSKFLKQYLLDEAGWDFFSYVIRTIFYIEHRVLDVHSICEFKGIHPMFWVEFFKWYKLEYKRKASRSYIPSIVLDKSMRMIYIKFPYNKSSNELKRSVINSKDKMTGRLNDWNYLQSSYKGISITKKLDTYLWKINVWNSNIVKYAYFDKNGQYISETDNLYNGEFYVVTKSIDEIPFGEVVSKIGNLDTANLDSFNIYKVWISNDEKKSRKVTLSWKNRDNSLPINCYFEIFQQSISNIVIDNIDLLEKNKEILLYDIGDGIKKINDYYGLKEFFEDIKNKECFFGEIWSEPIGISGSRSSGNSLRFCVIPKCKLELPRDLFGYNELIQFTSDSQYINFKDCLKDEKGIWNIKKNVLNLEGNVTVKSLNLRFNYSLNRVRLSTNSSYDMKYYFIDDISEELTFSIYANPRFRVSLILFEGNKRIELIKNCKINEMGICTFKASDIRQKLVNIDFTVGKLYLKCNNRHIDCSFGILNFNNLIGNIENIANDNKQLMLLKSIDLGISEKIMQIRSINNNSLKSVNYIKKGIYCDKLDNFYENMLFLASIFDGVIIKGKTEGKYKDYKENIKNEEMIKLIDWYFEARQAIDNGNYELMKHLKEQYKNLISLKISRWNEKLNRLYSKLNLLSDKSKMLMEWSNEVKKLKQFSLKSDISKKENGKILTYAWMSYIKGNYQKSIQYLEGISNSKDSLIIELQIMLRIVIYFKLLRFSALREIFKKYSNDTEEIKLVIDAYKLAYNIILKNDVNSYFDIVIGIEWLPFREEEKEFMFNLNNIKNLKSKAELIDINEVKESNWMVSLVYYNLLKNNLKYSSIIKENLKNKTSEIPESPSKIQILGDILE